MVKKSNGLGILIIVLPKGNQFIFGEIVSGASTMVDYEALERLARLHANGALNDTEYEIEKNVVMSGEHDERTFDLQDTPSGLSNFLKNEFREHPIISGCILLLVVAISYAVFVQSFFPTPSMPDYDMILPPGVTEYVTAEELQGSFDSNEIATIKRFEGEVVLLSGRVDRVTADIFDNPTVHLDSGGIGSIKIHLSSASREFAAQISPNQTVYFQCVGINEVFGSPVFSECMPSSGPRYVQKEALK